MKLKTLIVSLVTLAAVAACGTPAKVVVTSTSTPGAGQSAAAPAQALTAGQQNAIEKAQSYLDYSAFSRKGLIGQLEYEGFSTADAKFAVNNLNVDWNAQAAAKAKSYLEYQAFSKKGLIEQLEYEGFTSEQAAYGAKAAGL